MGGPDSAAALREAEAQYDDEVIGENTLGELFEESVERYGDQDAQLYKGGVYPRSLTPDVVPEVKAGEFGSITYERMGEIVRSLAAGFRALGVDADDRVGIFSETRMEWALSDYALLAAGGVVTTLYTESSPKTLSHLLNDPDAIGVVCENEAQVDRLVTVNDELDLEFVVVMDELQEYTHVDQIHSLADVYRLGEREFDHMAYASWLDDRESHDLASIVYTSGTTGKPKGVTLTHMNVRANVNQLRKRAGPRPDRENDKLVVDDDKTTISLLPLAHIYERTTGHFFAYASGCTVGFAENTDTVEEDIQKIQPHGGTSVPLVYERIFEEMRNQASESDLKQRIFNWAVEIGREVGRTPDPSLGLRVKHRVADTLVFRQVRQQMGGNVLGMFSGGGSLDPDLAALFKGMGIPIYEGYGLTEAAPVVTVNPPEDLRPGTLGPKLPGMEIRIDPTKVSDDQFEDARGVVGELCVKGPNVTNGYWGMPEKSEESFTPQGFFRTGDVVERTEDGYLVYHDRLKNLMVLSTGKNVAPVPIENKFATSSRVEQIMVMGDDEKFVSALIVPNFEAVWRWADNRGIELPDNKIGVCMNDRVREWVAEDVELVNRNFEEHETIKRFELVPTEWTPENNLLTPSLKKKRHNIVEEHADRVQAIYGDEAKAVTADD